MRLARYQGGGQIAIEDEPAPPCPDGGLLVRTLASGLCSGELMEWYMDRKIPHVLGHEVCGEVLETGDERFPVGCRVFVHHHAPCLSCPECERRAYVHCEMWKSTKIFPGGMSEYFAVPSINLSDTLRVDDIRPQDAALIEPLACVVKSLWRLRYEPGQSCAVVGLGVMGLLHMLLMPGAIGFDTNPARREWARNLGMDARDPEGDQGRFEKIIVCPGSAKALNWGLDRVLPQGGISLFAPLPPSTPLSLDFEKLYFRDVFLSASYSCGPDDTRQAAEILREGIVKAEQVVSDFITLDELPGKYLDMKRGQIVKAMVMFA